MFIGYRKKLSCISKEKETTEYKLLSVWQHIALHSFLHQAPVMLVSQLLPELFSTDFYSCFLFPTKTRQIFFNGMSTTLRSKRSYFSHFIDFSTQHSTHFADKLIKIPYHTYAHFRLCTQYTQQSAITKPCCHCERTQEFTTSLKLMLSTGTDDIINICV